MFLDGLVKKKIYQANIYSSHILPRYIDHLKKKKAPRVLDLGYISGKNIEFLAKLGFTVYVEDYLNSISWEELQPRILPRRKKTKKKLLEVKNLNYTQDYFDGILCWDLFDYLDFEDGKWLIKEIWKILKPEGVAFSLFDSYKSSLYQSHRKKIFIYDENHLFYDRVPFIRTFFTTYENRDIFALFAEFNILESYYVKNGMREILIQKRLSYPK
ncbi:MAG: methyltransferase domain-containing protein [Candidatus Aminicenantia bacterium]